MLRYAAGILYNAAERRIAGLQPMHFMTMATPHLGCDAAGEPQVQPPACLMRICSAAWQTCTNCGLFRVLCCVFQASAMHNLGESAQNTCIIAHVGGAGVWTAPALYAGS
jgi:Putative serine esterase (DUF676)